MPVRTIRIALIEDSQTVRFFYKAVFEKAGFEVLEAENAKDGWAVICDERPDIIVLDMMLPEISGLELLKRIRSVEFSKKIPVLVLTSVKEIDQVQEIIRQGANYYSVKGQDSPEKIKEMIYRLLKRKQEKEAGRQLEGREGEDSETADDPGVDRLWWN
ncbi:response regulator [bacterium]|nr:response regulator [bacterium]